VPLYEVFQGEKMVKIRLTRMGAKKAPFYRIVAMDSRKHRDGQYIEQIGYYDPTKTPADVKIDAEIAKKWLGNGAEPTATVKDLFFKAGIIQ
jgi:small subunit ribosomal protein S16